MVSSVQDELEPDWFSLHGLVYPGYDWVFEVSCFSYPNFGFWDKPLWATRKRYVNQNATRILKAFSITWQIGTLGSGASWPPAKDVVEALLESDSASSWEDMLIGFTSSSNCSSHWFIPSSLSSFYAPWLNAAWSKPCPGNPLIFWGNFNTATVTHEDPHTHPASLTMGNSGNSKGLYISTRV